MLSLSDLNIILGHDWMDNDHRHLAQLILELQEVLLGRNEPEAVARAACDLVEFTRKHFRDEERLMIAHGYDDLEAHKADHHLLLRHLTLQLVAWTLNAERPSEGDLAFFRDWFRGHAENHDWSLAMYLTARQCGSGPSPTTEDSSAGCQGRSHRGRSPEAGSVDESEFSDVPP